MNDKFSLSLSADQLNNYALQLGSDCPFFLFIKPCFATGRGEQLQPVNLNLSSYKILLVNPNIHIDTTWAFSKIQPVNPQKSANEIILQPIETWKFSLKNDFEDPVFEVYPEIKKIKDILYEREALYVSLSGSGSTVYGIFNNVTFVNSEFPANYFTRLINLK